MASSNHQARRRPQFNLRPTILYEDYPKIKLCHTYTPASTPGDAHHITNRQDVAFCPDGSDKEHLVRTLHEFVHACRDNRLHINNEDRYVELRHVLGGDLRRAWDHLVDTFEEGDLTNANFPEHLRLLVRRFCPSNSFVVQREYFFRAKKPYGMDCYNLWGRLALLNTLSQYLPGSNGAVLFADDASKKEAFYRLMLPEWQTAFDNTGRRLDDPTCSLVQLMDFMEQQHTTNRQLPPRLQALRDQYNSRNGGPLRNYFHHPSDSARQDPWNPAYWPAYYSEEPSYLRYTPGTAAYDDAVQEEAERAAFYSMEDNIDVNTAWPVEQSFEDPNISDD